MKKINFFLVFIICCIGWSQNSTRYFEGIKIDNNQLSIKTNDGNYQFLLLNNRVLETTFVPKNTQITKNNFAVIQRSESKKGKIKKSHNGHQYFQGDYRIDIQHAPFQISYYHLDKFIISEKEGFQKLEEGFQIDFNLQPNEVLYGGGARVLGMNRRGHQLPLYNRAHYGYEVHSNQMNYALPMVLSSNRYAIHFDNHAIGHIDLDSKQNNTMAFHSISGSTTYQIIANNSWYELLDAYTELTGKQPLPPRWVLGNFSSRFGYHDQAEVKYMVDRYRRDSIPLDAIILDLFWFGKEVKGTMGNLDWDPDNFSRPDEMLEYNKKHDIKTILVTEPFILTTSNRWKEAVEADVITKGIDGKPHTFDFYFGNTGLIDIFNPKSKSWFWNIYKRYIDQGIDGWWGDLGEPEVHPSELQHYNGTADELHNVYGHEWAKMLFDGYSSEYTETRPFILMRAGYSGSQRYGMIPWSGDVNRTWGGLSGQTEISLQMGMQGLAYMHSDLGGFAGANEDDELYVRWLQYGVFQPIFRPHAQEEVPSEPVFKNNKTKHLSKLAIELRYQLLPYNYSMLFENSTKGTPLMIPLLFEEPENINAHTDASNYFWGRNIWVQPILKDNTQSLELNFPKKNDWYDINQKTWYNAGDKVLYDVKEEFIPTFARAGSLIPIIPTIQNTDQYNPEFVEWNYYAHTTQEGHGMLYHDDGHTNQAIEQGKFEIIYASSKPKKNVLELQFQKKIGAQWKSEINSTKINIVGLDEAPLRILNGKLEIPFHYNPTTQSYQFEIKFVNETTNIQIYTEIK